MRDRPPRREALPISCHELLRKAQEKTNKLAASVIEPRDFTPEEIAARPPYTSNDAGEADEDDEDPWAAVGPSENEGASVGKAKASHAAPQKASVAKPAAKDPAPPKAASTGASLPENADDDAVYPTHTKGQVQKYRCAMDEGTNGKEVEHVVVDQHPFELITRTCWEMEGAEKLKHHIIWQLV